MSRLRAVFVFREVSDDPVFLIFAFFAQGVEKHLRNVVIQSLVIEKEFCQQTQVLAIRRRSRAVDFKHRQFWTNNLFNFSLFFPIFTTHRSLFDFCGVPVNFVPGRVRQRATLFMFHERLASFAIFQTKFTNE